MAAQHTGYIGLLCAQGKTLMDVVLATCSSFDYIAEACDIVAESCTCRQTKVVIPASTILRTCASPLSRDLYNQQLIVDSSFSQANRDTRCCCDKGQTSKLRRLSNTGNLSFYRETPKAIEHRADQ